MTDALIKRERFEDMEDTKGSKTCYDGRRDCSDAAIIQGMPRIVGNHQRLRKGREGFFLRSFRGRMATTLILDVGLQTCETINFSCFQPLSLW